MLPIIKKIDIVRFLELSKTSVIADVRSPSEYVSGHIPGSFNIPLFDDDGRKAVGTIYKKQGRIPAIFEGLKLSGPELSSKLGQALNITQNKKLLVHCWRGGMRSEAMAWLFSLGDIETEVLDGGYKSYRNHVLKSLSSKRRMIILGGMTGSSKTHILRFLKESGKQVIDLEGLANHKGSAFGSLGEQPQPTTEYFSNLLFGQWTQMDINQPIWVEDESRNIGSVFMPEGLYLNMQDAPAIILRMDVKTRLPRLMKEYSVYPAELLKASIIKISKRLGGDNTRDAINAIETGDIWKAIEITLQYYDKAYLFGLKKKNTKTLVYIETNSDDIEVNAMKVLEAADQIKW